MKRLLLTVPALVAAGLVTAPAQAIGRLADVTVTDRDSGATLLVHYHRGEYWVEGQPGTRYGIAIHNQQGVRLLAVTAVDGVNVISGETAKFDQQGYVFDAWSGYDITGWRKSDAQVAAFEFTSVPRSYAARTGRPDNVGVIGVALFRERAPLQSLRQESSPFAPAPAAAPGSAPAAAADAAGKAGAELRLGRMAAAAAAPAPVPALGTGHGRREDSRVTQVGFEREQSQPDEIVRIRYDSHANLVAMGVIRDLVPQPPRWPQPFPDEPRRGYVPDP